MPCAERLSQRLRNLSEKYLDKTVSIVALFAGLFALILSWNANRLSKEANDIAFQQLEPRITVTGLLYNGALSASDQDGGHAACTFLMTVANIGNPVDSVIGYRVKVIYAEKQVELENTDSGSSLAVYLEKLTPAIYNLRSVFVKSEAPFYFPLQGNKPQVEYLEIFPIQVGAKTTINIPATINFDYDERKIQLESPVHADPRSYMYAPDKLYGLYPLEVFFELKMMSGQIITSPKSECCCQPPKVSTSHK